MKEADHRAGVIFVSSRYIFVITSVAGIFGLKQHRVYLWTSSACWSSTRGSCHSLVLRLATLSVMRSHHDLGWLESGRDDIFHTLYDWSFTVIFVVVFLSKFLTFILMVNRYTVELIMKAHPVESPPWLKPTRMKDHPNKRPPWWEATPFSRSLFVKLLPW